MASISSCHILVYPRIITLPAGAWLFTHPFALQRSVHPTQSSQFSQSTHPLQFKQLLHLLQSSHPKQVSHPTHESQDVHSLHPKHLWQYSQLWQKSHFANSVHLIFSLSALICVIALLFKSFYDSSK